MALDFSGLSQRIEALMETAVIPGLSIAIIDEGQLTWTKAFGAADATTGEPITTETIFEAASLTKPLYAYLVLQLVEEGVLDLDAPLMSYLPQAEQTAERLFDVSGQNESAVFDYVVNETAVQQITLRHVLSHQPGFPNWTGPGKPLQLHLTPGQRFSYSGDGYNFSQKVLAHGVGVNLVDLMRERVLSPLGMNHSSPIGVGLETFHVATGHNQTGEVTEKWRSPELYVAATMHTTPADYAQFVLALVQPQTHNLLSADMVRAMLRPQVQVNDCAPWHHDWPREQVNLEPDLFWGLGWGLERQDDDFAFWHWGDNGSFKAFVWGMVGTGTAVILMANSNNGDDVWGDILTEILGLHFPSYDWLMRMAAYNAKNKKQTTA